MQSSSTQKKAEEVKGTTPEELFDDDQMDVDIDAQLSKLETVMRKGKDGEETG